MKVNKLLIVIVASMLLTSSFVAINVFAAQPPIATNTYYIGTIGQPRRMDPARAYDTASGDVIQNVYDTLVYLSDKPTAPVPVSPDRSTDMASGPQTDLSVFLPSLATALPTISVDGKTWTFTIRNDAVFHDWTDHLGVVHSGDVLTAADVEYYFERMLVQDCAGAPSWMFCLPGLGYMFLDELDPDPDTNGFDTNEATVATLIDNFVSSSGNTVTFNFVSAWPQTAMLQIFSQTWGGIPNKAFCIEHGCWDGTWTAGWSASWRRKPSNSYSPLDLFYAAKSKFTTSTVPVMCGTGPYKFTSWDKANKIWRFDRFANYWGGWTNAGDGAGNYISTVIERGVDNWPTRKMLFLEGEFDSCAVPRANMYDLLEGSDIFQPITGLHLYYNTPALSNDVIFFNLNVASESSYKPKVNNVVQLDFFTNVHMRRAFTFALNFTDYLANAWFNEAVQQDSWWVDGLQPAAAKLPPVYPYEHKTLNTTKMQEELQQAYFPTAGPNSVWDYGFYVDLAYNIGNDQRRIGCEMIAAAFQSLGSKYQVNVIALDWPVILDYMETRFLPNFIIGWLADFAHPDNFARPYMHTYGDFSYFQNYSDSHVDDLLAQGIVELNETHAIEIYRELQQIYYDDAPGLPLMQAVGRRWCRDWVRGWYYNQLNPGFTYYDYYKQVGALENVDLDVTGTITPVVSYPAVYWYGQTMLIGNGNPDPAVFTYSVHVERNDANTNIGQLLATVGLSRNNGTYTEYPNNTLVLLAPGEDATVVLDWWENGAVAGIFQQGTWTIGARTGSVNSNANDTNTANNVVTDGSVSATGPLTGDIKVDGIVDIFDAIQLAGVFGKSAGDTGFNPAADLNGDDTVDIYDAILLAGNFNKHIP